MSPQIVGTMGSYSCNWGTTGLMKWFRVRIGIRVRIRVRVRVRVGA